MSNNYNKCDISLQSASEQISFQQFPYPAYRHDNFVEVLTTFLPMCTVISFVMLCPAILKRVVEEKESGVEVCLF
jgi:hypothetical protein